MTIASQHIESKGDDKIEGLQLVYMTGGKLDGSEDRDDTGYPYRLEINLSAPQLMVVTFVMLYGGTEKIVVRAKTREAIDAFIAKNDFRRHPRFLRMSITGPQGMREEIGR